MNSLQMLTIRVYVIKISVPFVPSLLMTIVMFNHYITSICSGKMFRNNESAASNTSYNKIT